jgi:hypothetical protein
LARRSRGTAQCAIFAASLCASAVVASCKTATAASRPPEVGGSPGSSRGRGHRRHEPFSRKVTGKTAGSTGQRNTLKGRADKGRPPAAVAPRGREPTRLPAPRPIAGRARVGTAGGGRPVGPLRVKRDGAVRGRRRSGCPPRRRVRRWTRVAEEPEVDQDTPHDPGIVDRRQDPHAPTTPRTGEDVDGKDALEQVGPAPARRAREYRRGLACSCGRLPGVGRP